MAEFNWTTLGTLTTALSGELDSLANDGLKIKTTAIDNADGDFYAAWEFNLASINLSAQDNPCIRVWFVRSADGGTGYEDGSDSIEPAKRPDIIFPLREVNAAQKVIVDFVLTPHNFKPLLKNDTGAAFAATGNTLKYAKYSTESN